MRLKGDEKVVGEKAMNGKKVVVIGFDCMEPTFAFDKFQNIMPNLTELRKRGVWGKLKTIVPPITVPAWSSMFTGVDPGYLGIYGFRNRIKNSYELDFVTSKSINVARVWELLSRAGLTSIVLFVPQTYPPYPIKGYMVSDFLTPGPESEYTYPKELKQELERRFGPYIVDVANFRTEDKDRLLEDIYKMTEQHFEMAIYMISEFNWDLFIMVDMGMDRLHHGFWKFFDEAHPKFIPGNRYINVVEEYYKYCDKKLGELLEKIDIEKTYVVVASDHGAKAMIGGFCINDWLIKEGYLKIKKQPLSPTSLKLSDIDWKGTKAWGEGGYYGRLFINLKGRDPEGVVDPKDYEKVREEIKSKIESLKDHKGENMKNIVYKPEEIYPLVNGFPPDLIVIFGDLDWRSVGSIGNFQLYTFENDTGPDDANHSWYGCFVLCGPGIENREIEEVDIRAIAPTILDIFGLKVPSYVQVDRILLR